MFRQQIVQSDVLLRKRADQIAVLQAGDCENWSMIHLCVVEAIQKVDAARPGGRDAYSQSACELCRRL
jgi:hypothetical protein